MEVLAVKDLVDFSQEKRVRKALVRSGGLSAEIVCYEPGQHTLAHHHPNQDELFYVVEGEGVMQVGEEQVAVAPGSVVFVSDHTQHGITASAGTRLVVLFVKGPGTRRFDGPLNTATTTVNLKTAP